MNLLGLSGLVASPTLLTLLSYWLSEHSQERLKIFQYIWNYWLIDLIVFVYRQNLNACWSFNVTRTIESKEKGKILVCCPLLLQGHGISNSHICANSSIGIGANSRLEPTSHYSQLYSCKDNSTVVLTPHHCLLHTVNVNQCKIV